jgi:predicted Zn-dependent peptidase
MRFRILLGAFLSAAVITVAPPSSAVTPWDPAREPETLTLDNGLTAAILPWEGLPLVEVRVFYPSSPVTEPEGKDGIAHLVEHLMFTSAPRYPDGGLDRELELFACTSNAATSVDHTRYLITCSPAHLDRILRLEAARMRGPEPTPEELDRERSIVLEELAYRSHSSGSSDLGLEVLRASFPGHPFGRPVGGTRETMESITAGDVSDYVRDVHGPSGAVLVIAGDVDAEALRARITELFGRLPASGAGRVEVEPAEPGAGASVRLDRWDMEGYAVRLGFRIPRKDPHHVPLAAFTRELLRDSFPSVTLTLLNDEYVLLCGAKYSYSRTDWAGDPKEPDADETERRAHAGDWSAIQRVMSELDQETFDRFRERMSVAYEDAFRDPGWVAHYTGLSLLQQRDLLAAAASFDSLAAELTLDEVRTYLREQLRADRAVFGIAHGRDSGRLVNVPLPAQVGDGETDAPRTVPARELDLASVREALDGYRDLRIRIRPGTDDDGPPVHRVEVPGASWTLALAHQSFEPLEEEKRGKRRGLVRGYRWLLGRSASKPDSAAVSPPRIDVDLEVSERTVSAQGRSAETAASLRAVAEVLRGERTDVDEWRGLQRVLGSSLKSLGRSGWMRAIRSRLSALFGPEHPMVGPYAADEEDAERVLYKNVAELEKDLARGEGLQIFLAGDPDAVGAEGTDETLRKLKARERKKRVVPETRLEGISGAVIPVFHKLDVDLVLSFPPFSVGADGDPDWAATELGLEVARYRIRERLREQLGLVYFVWLADRTAGDALVIEVGTAGRPEDMTQVFQELWRSLAVLAADGFTEEELARARLACVRRTARWWDSPSRVDGALVDMSRHGSLPEDPPGALLAAGADEVAAAIGSWLRPDRFAFSLVGPLLEEDLERFQVPADGSGVAPEPLARPRGDGSGQRRVGGRHGLQEDVHPARQHLDLHRVHGAGLHQLPDVGLARGDPDLQPDSAGRGAGREHAAVGLPPAIETGRSARLQVRRDAPHVFGRGVVGGAGGLERPRGGVQRLGVHLHSKKHLRPPEREPCFPMLVGLRCGTFESFCASWSAGPGTATAAPIPYLLAVHCGSGSSIRPAEM